VKVALSNCLLLDGSGSRPRRGATVVVDGDTIAEVTDRRDLGSAVRVLDLDGLAVMPGLIDCHIHFALWSFDLLSHRDEPLSYLHARTLKALRETLEAGCTAARDPGGLDVGFRDAIADGVCRGPRIRTSITIVSPTNGIADSTGLQGIPVPYPPGIVSPECNGPDEARTKVRELVRAGADFVKIAVSGGVSSPRRSPRHRLFTEQEIAAVVDEAHAWGLPVACHALGGPGPLAAIRAGVDSIEHGVWLDAECVDEMAARGTWYVPTLAAYEWHAELGGDRQRDYAAEMRKSHRASLERAHEAGVRIACGSDAGVYGFDFARELELLVDAGVAPGAAIAAATSKAAECLGWSDRIGTVAAGLQADLLVVDGNPDESIDVIRRPGAIRCVLQAGEAVVDTIGLDGPPGPAAATARSLSGAAA
jgi:imidazolonepropionase-like amidohydrolase